MNVNSITCSVLLSVICVLLAILQFYYLNLKKAATARRLDPYFKDLIITPDTNSVVNYDTKSISDETVDLKKSTILNIEGEVEQCLKAAMAYRTSGKIEKALKLYEHAVLLAPNNPDVLNVFGEFLEKHQKDVISADELYYKALSQSPDHTGALENRKRTAHLVDQLDLIMFKRIDEKRDLLKSRLHHHIDFETKKKAYYLHIYHTVGIEGNTMTINQLTYLLETGRAVSGKSIIEHNEILGLQIALRYVKILTNTKYIDVSDILEIHKRVMGHVDPLSSGIFRDQQVYIGSHVPPAPDQVRRLMNEFVDWLNSDEASNMHPVRLAALAHYKFVDIHPFTDGNGRTSRLIMNLILLRMGYPPVIIYKEDRQKYYECLNTANTGDVRPFVRFIAYCTDDMLNTYLGLNNKLEVVNKKQSQIIEIDGIKTVGY